MILKLSKDKRINALLHLLWIGAILACIKSIFTDTAWDNSYSVAMSYRHLSGDMMFQEMWEPHQTSIFMTDILMMAYRIFVPDLTGVVLFLQICGTVLFGIISIPLYKCIKKISTSEVAQLSCIFFNVFRAKQTPFPEYSNLLVAFSTLSFICLITFLGDQKKIRYLIYTGICICFAVLTYPSAVFMFPFVIILLCMYSTKRVRNSIVVSAVCIVSGSVYTLYFALKIGLESFASNIKSIITIDSHFVSEETVNDLSLKLYFKDFFIATVWIAISFIAAWLLTVIIKKVVGKKTDCFALFSIILTVGEVIFLVLQKKGEYSWITKFYIIPVFLIVLALLFIGRTKEEERRVLVCGLLISSADFMAALCFSNLEFITICAYLVLGGCVSFVSIRHLNKNALLAGIMLCALVTVHRGLLVYGYLNTEQKYMVYEVNNYIRNGPAFGIVCDRANALYFKDSAADHANYIDENDVFMLVAYGWLDSAQYLLPEGSIANCSTINTPFYSEQMQDYYVKYPEKKPTVVAMANNYGALAVSEDSFIYKWVTENYSCVAEGNCWNYYRIDK